MIKADGKNQNLINVFFCLFDDIIIICDKRAERFGTQHYLFSCFTIILHGAPLFFGMDFPGTQPRVIIIMRAIGGFLSFLLIFKEAVPEVRKPYFSLYWYFVLLYCLPFMSTYTLLQDQAYYLWFFMSYFLLSVLVDWCFFIIISVLGSSLALCMIGYSEGFDFVFSATIAQLFTNYTFLFVILIILVFLRNRDLKIYERFSAYKVLSGYIAHEMRKPLAFVSASSEGWAKNSPYLFEAYELAVKKGIYEEKINPIALSSLKKIPTEFQKVSCDGLLFIEMLLAQTDNLDNQKNFCHADALTTIQEVVERWHAGPKRNNKVYFSTSFNFKYYGTPILLKHVLFELLRNSEYFASTSKESNITICCKRNFIWNEICFMDNGQGVDSFDVARVFEHGFSKRRYGTGIGLSFCKNVMLQMRGEIRLRSKYGEFTEVTLSFPVLKG